MSELRWELAKGLAGLIDFRDERGRVHGWVRPDAGRWRGVMSAPGYDLVRRDGFPDEPTARAWVEAEVSRARATEEGGDA